MKRKWTVWLVFALVLLAGSPAFAAAVPDPAEILGGRAVPYVTDYAYDENWICDGYTFASPADWDDFIQQYIKLARTYDLEIMQTVQSGKAVWLLMDEENVQGMLVPDFLGSLLLLTDQGAQLSSVPAAAPSASPTPVPAPAPEAASAADESPDGYWFVDYVMQDCADCINGKCPLCGGTGRYRQPGDSWDDGVFCRTDCATCFGLGTVEVEQPVWVSFE